MKHTDEDELRDLFAEIEAPASLDERWRERIADVHAEPHDPLPETADPEDPEQEPETNGAKVIALPVGQELRPGRHKRRNVAVAAAAAVVVGLGGLVVTSQLLSDAPPADPTMIIDGPDRTVSTAPPTKQSDKPTGTATSPPSTGGPTGTGADNPPDAGGNDGNPGGTDPGPGDDGGQEAVWPPMVGDPTGTNTGVPLGATLADHHGDLRITTPGQVVTDLRVTGSIIVDAPNVTLRRVIVIAPFGVPAVTQLYGNLTVENSELTGGQSLSQRADGLVVRRSRIESGLTLTSRSEVYDSYLSSSDVLVTPGTTGVQLRHNVFNRVTMNDIEGPIRSVRIEYNVLTQVDAPTEDASASIYVFYNRFRGNAPSTGWQYDGTDYRWTDNTLLETGESTGP